MTNNIDTPTKALIYERVQGRDIEKMFDTFIENITDTVIDALELQGDDQAMNDYSDYIIEAVMSTFNYQLKK